jgi:hypothetical protein
VIPIPNFNFGNPLLAVWDFFYALALGDPLGQALLSVLLEYCVFHAVLMIYCCVRAVRKLRPVALQPEAPKPLWRRAGIEFPPRRRRPRLGRWPPLLWKEIHADAPIGSHRFSALLMYLYLVLGWVLVAFFIVSLWTSAAFSDSPFSDRDFDWQGLMRISNGLASGMPSMPPAASAANASGRRSTPSLPCPSTRPPFSRPNGWATSWRCARSGGAWASSGVSAL